MTPVSAQATPLPPQPFNQPIECIQRAKLDRQFAALRAGAAAPANYQNFFAPYDTLPGGYHGYDFSFFSRNVEKNVVERVAAYLQRH